MFLLTVKQLGNMGASQLSRRKLSLIAIFFFLFISTSLPIRSVAATPVHIAVWLRGALKKLNDGTTKNCLYFFAVTCEKGYRW
jgi:hypothetical protein